MYIYEPFKFLSLENFRLFRERVTFQFSDINIITGTNSSGKSSLIKSLMLLKENIGQGFPWLCLKTGGNVHNLGGYKDIINRTALTDEISFKLPINFYKGPNGNPFSTYVSAKPGTTHKIFRDDLILSIARSKDEERNEGLSFPGNPWTLSLTYSRCENSVHGVLKNLKVYNGELSETLLEYSPLINNWDAREFLITLNVEYVLDFIRSNQKIIYKGDEIANDSLLFIYNYTNSSSIKDLQNILHKIELKIVKDHFSKSEVGDSYLTQYDELLGLVGDDLTDFIIDDINKELTEQDLQDHIKAENPSKLWYFFSAYTIQLFEVAFKSFANLKMEHLPSVRGTLHRLYTMESQGTPFNESIDNYANRNIDKSSKEGIFLSKWLKKFEIGDWLEVENTEGVVNAPYIIRGKNRVLLADLGFGYTQLLPIILLCATTENRLLLIEEPEANLHPAFQSLLADMFCDTTNTMYKQFILETHSEYFVRKFQYLVAKKSVEARKVRIFYFDKIKGKITIDHVVRNIEICDDGYLSEDFGPGFFDESDNLAIDLFNLKKSQNN